MSRAHSLGFELPVFEPDRPLLFDVEQYVTAAIFPEPIDPYAPEYQDGDDSATTFLRWIHVDGKSQDSLPERIMQGYNEFHLLRTMCNVEVVPYTYGLYPAKHASPRHLEILEKLDTHESVPKGYILAAEVSIIVPEDPDYLYMPPEISEFCLSPYTSDLRPGRLDDIYPEQFLWGHPKDTSLRNEWYLVDIELLIDSHRYS